MIMYTIDDWEGRPDKRAKVRFVITIVCPYREREYALRAIKNIRILIYV